MKLNQMLLAYKQKIDAVVPNFQQDIYIYVLTSAATVRRVIHVNEHPPRSLNSLFMKFNTF